MKTSEISAWLRATLIATTTLVALAPLCSRAADTPATTEVTNEPTIVMSPFVVSTDKDTGFIANSALAGGRLNTSLKDTPVAYAVITRDFIDALGINDLQTAADWSPNTFRVPGTNTGSFYNDISTDPYSYNVRGSISSTPQRNFFSANGPMLSYALERYDFGRGPNAVLFGNGGLGGVSSSTTKMAKIGQNFASLKQEFGSWNYYNTTLDVNRSLIDQRLAVRVAATYKDSDGYREREFFKDRAAFATTTFKPFKDTSIRLEGEVGDWARQIPGSILNDKFSGWNGTTTFNGPFTAANPIPANANALGVGQKVRASNSNAQGAIIYNPYAGAIYNYDKEPITLTGGSTSTTPYGGFVQGSLPSFNGGGATIGALLYPVDVPANPYANAINGSAFRVPSKSFSVAKDTPELTQRFNDLQLTVDQKFGNFFLEAAGDWNKDKFEAHTIGVRGGEDIYIDIDHLHPDGTPNPDFLQPYTDGQLRKNLSSRETKGLRGAAGYVLDAGVWGNYTASFQGGLSRLDREDRVYNMSIAQNADHRRWGAAAQTLGQTDLIRIRNYIFDPGARPYAVPATVQFIDPVNGTSQQIKPIWALEEDRSDSVQNTLTNFNYGIAALNAKFWKDRIVLLGALRRDNFTNTIQQTIAGGDYSATTWDGVTPIFKPSAPADFTTLTFIPKNAAGIATGAAKSADTRPRDVNGTPLPQYAGDRFKDDYNAPVTKANVTTPSYGAVVHLTHWLSVTGNYAETFNTPESIQRLNSTFLTPTVSKGSDFSLRGSFLHGLLDFSVLRYQDKTVNSSFDPGIENQINNILQTPAVGNPGGLGRNERGEPNVPQTVRDLQDQYGQGWEFEMVANITNSWRAMLNLGVPKNYTLNRYQDSRIYLAGHLPILAQVVTDAGGVIDANNVATVSPTVGPADQANANTAVTNWNNLQNAIKGFGDGRRSATDQTPKSINVFTDYTFKSGFLNGFSAGIGMNYRGAYVIGNKANDTIVDPNNPAKAIPDPAGGVTQPVYARPIRTAVGTLGYVLYLKDKRSVNFRLRVDNLFNSQSPVYVNTTLRPRNNDYTSPARQTVPGNYVLPNPISFNFSVEFKI